MRWRDTVRQCQVAGQRHSFLQTLVALQSLWLEDEMHMMRCQQKMTSLAQVLKL